MKTREFVDILKNATKELGLGSIGIVFDEESLSSKKDGIIEMTFLKGDKFDSVVLDVEENEKQFAESLSGAIEYYKSQNNEKRES